jgi:hypothetical protein
MTHDQDIFAPEPDLTPPAPSGYLVCECDRLTIAIPQADVVTIEHAGELAAPLPGEAVVGWFACNQGPWPVFALDSRLALTQAPQTQRSFLVFLKSQPWPLGLLMNTVKVIGKASDLPLRPLPQPFANFALGIDGVARLSAERLVFGFGESKLPALLHDLTTPREVRYG